jgi:transposase-like protein
MSIKPPEERAAQRDAFVRAVVEGKSVAKIAEAAGISERSVYNWSRRPGIRKRIEQTLDRMRDAHVNGMIAASTKARRALVKLLKSDDEKVQLGAARTLVGESAKIIELRSQLAAAGARLADAPPTESLEQIEERMDKLIADRQALANGHQEGNGRRATE